MHLFGFIIRIYHDARSRGRQNIFSSSCIVLGFRTATHKICAGKHRFSTTTLNYVVAQNLRQIPEKKTLWKNTTPRQVKYTES